MDSTEPGTLGFASLNLSEPGRKKFTPDFLKGGRDRTRFILRQSNFVSRSERLAALAVRHPVPTVFENREFIAAGGLMGCGGRLANSRESSKMNLQANSSPRSKNRQIRLLERVRSFSPFNGF